MKIIYAAHRYDPRHDNIGGGIDYRIVQALLRAHHEVEILGPFKNNSHPIEQYWAHIFRKIVGKGWLRFYLSATWHESQALNKLTRSLQPDLIVTRFPTPIAFYREKVPVIYRLDASHDRSVREYTHFSYSHLTLPLARWIQKRAFERSSKIITHSDWFYDVLIDDYGVQHEKIVVLPLAAPLPEEVVPDSWTPSLQKELIEPLQLLFVGRDAYRKGLDIAIEVVNLLNQAGIVSKLTVCGLEQPDQPHVHFAGFFNKLNSDELKVYVDYYKRSHFLLHPARFEPYGQLTCEAAAFGTPVITNNVGGLGSAVTEESGIVLPGNSPAADYVEVIKKLWFDADAYHALCASAHGRFIRELNWKVLGKRLSEVLEAIFHDSDQHDIVIRRSIKC